MISLFSSIFQTKYHFCLAGVCSDALQKLIPKFKTNIPRKGIARPQSQFPHSSHHVTTIDLLILLQERCGPILGIYNSLTDTWMWKLRRRPHYSRRGILYINGIFVAVWSFFLLPFTNQLIVLKTFLVKLIATQNSIFFSLITLYA